MAGSRSALAGLTASLSVSVLGYNLLQNPRGFVLATVYQAFVDFVLGLAGQAASQMATAWTMATTAVVDAGAAALGTPGRLAGGALLWIVGQVNGFGLDVAGALGPFGFVGIPLAWGLATIGTLTLLAVVWNGYKWVRTVVV